MQLVNDISLVTRLLIAYRRGRFAPRTKGIDWIRNPARNTGLPKGRKEWKVRIALNIRTYCSSTFAFLIRPTYARRRWSTLYTLSTPKAEREARSTLFVRQQSRSESRLTLSHTPPSTATDTTHSVRNIHPKPHSDTLHVKQTPQPGISTHSSPCENDSTTMERYDLHHQAQQRPSNIPQPLHPEVAFPLRRRHHRSEPQHWCRNSQGLRPSRRNRSHPYRHHQVLGPARDKEGSRSRCLISRPQSHRPRRWHRRSVLCQAHRRHNRILLWPSGLAHQQCRHREHTWVCFQQARWHWYRELPEDDGRQLYWQDRRHPSFAAAAVEDRGGRQDHCQRHERHGAFRQHGRHRLQHLRAGDQPTDRGIGRELCWGGRVGLCCPSRYRDDDAGPNWHEAWSSCDVRRWRWALWCLLTLVGQGETGVVEWEIFERQLGRWGIGGQEGCHCQGGPVEDAHGGLKEHRHGDPGWQEVWAYRNEKQYASSYTASSCFQE